MFAGSVDRLNYLQDDSGNRRFIIVEVGNNMDGFHEVVMQQVFAQCYQDLQNGENHFSAGKNRDYYVPSTPSIFRNHCLKHSS